MALSLINPNDNILIIGDGNFSYAYDVAVYMKRQNGKGKITTTSLDSLNELKKKYANVENFINKLTAMQHIIMHNIDATDLSNTMDSNNSYKKTFYDKI